MAALLVCGVVALAGEYGFILTEIKDDTVTGYKTKGKGEKDEKTTTFKVTKDAKIVKGMFDKDTMKFKAGDPIEGGLKNEMFAADKLKEGKTRVRLTTEGEGDAEKVTTIMSFTRPGK